MPPIRKTTRRGRGISGGFPSLKMERLIGFESLIERDLICLLDYHPRVMQFWEQPLTIGYEHLGKPRKYTPDFQVRFDDGRTLLFECKPQAQIDTPDNQLKFSAARQWCRRQGWSFVVVTDEHLRATWRLQNIRLLTQFARCPIDADIKARILACLANPTGPVSVGEVLQQVQPEAPQMVLIPVLHLAFHHAVAIALDEAPITKASLVNLPDPTLKRGGLWP